jgi:hypothetical protein
MTQEKHKFGQEETHAPTPMPTHAPAPVPAKAPEQFATPVPSMTKQQFIAAVSVHSNAGKHAFASGLSANSWAGDLADKIEASGIQTSGKIDWLKWLQLILSILGQFAGGVTPTVP